MIKLIPLLCSHKIIKYNFIGNETIFNCTKYFRALAIVFFLSKANARTILQLYVHNHRAREWSNYEFMLVELFVPLFKFIYFSQKKYEPPANMLVYYLEWSFTRHIFLFFHSLYDTKIITPQKNQQRCRFFAFIAMYNWVCAACCSFL